ncbi:MAG: PKD domain-containing protein [Desulforhopalus sp.]|nr:PKD domain-containing protein [Desulforhopalus sp.]
MCEQDLDFTNILNSQFWENKKTTPEDKYVNNAQLRGRSINIMKNNLLFFLFLLLIIPAISIGAEMRTIEVEFSFSDPDNSSKQLLGYRLYKEAEQVCETNDPSASRVDCELLTEDGTFDFTLTAHYSDNSESPPSPSFPFTIVSTTPPPSSEPPIAVLSSSTTVGNAPLAVSFTGTSSTTTNTSIVSYSWTFGDGSQSTGETTFHTFMTAGTYYTELTVLDSEGLSDNVTTPIIVLETAPANETPNAIISTSQAQVDAPFSLDASQSSDPDGSIVFYSWDFGDGTTGSGQTIQHTYTRASTYTVSLQVTDDKGATATATSEVVCSTTPNNAFNIEIGTVSIDHEWVQVLFENTFSQPVVIASPPSINGTDPAVVRIRNIDQEGFEICIQEWDYLDQTHTLETVSYLVIEKGAYTLDDGTMIEAGSFTASTSFQQVDLQQTYNVTPVILTQVMTKNETDAVTSRLSNINQISFNHKIQEQETTKTDHPALETIGYIAGEPGQGEVFGILYEIGNTTNSVTHDWFDLTFETDFPDLPFFFADMQTSDGGDTAALRTQNMSQTASQIMVEEEQSLDSETRHTTEIVGYFTIGAATE